MIRTNMFRKLWKKEEGKGAGEGGGGREAQSDQVAICQSHTFLLPVLDYP